VRLVELKPRLQERDFAANKLLNSLGEN